MTNECSEPIIERKPVEAAALSAILPGLGHIYLGLFQQGILWIGASVGLMTLAVAVLLMNPNGGGLVLASSCVVMSMLLSVTSVILVWRLGRSRSREIRRREYNRWYVYAVFILVGSIGTSMGFTYVFRSRVIEAFTIPSNSMSPTIRSGDRIVAVKEVFLDRDPERGELAVFRSPENRRQLWIKRVIAVSGDQVEWRANGDILLNGELLERTPAPAENEFRERIGPREYSISLDRVTDPTWAEGRLTVPPHHCFVLGDNRSSSKDSRHFGVVAYTNLLAKPVAKVWGGVGRLE